MKKNSTVQMNKAQRDYLRIRLAEAARRMEGECRRYLDSKQPKHVTDAMNIIKNWDEAKCDARSLFQEELHILTEKTKEAILFGTKEDFDKWFSSVEGLSFPAISVDRVTRGER